MKAVCFDFDGVLTGDQTGSESICRYLAEEAGLDYEQVLERYRRFNRQLIDGSAGHEDIWPEFCDAVGVDMPIEILSRAYTNTPIDAQMVSVVRGARRAGMLTGMITDNKVDRIKAVLEAFRLEALFDVVAVSAAVGSGKREQAIFEVALDGLKLPARDVLFIDNDPKNLIVPAGMGMGVYHFDDRVRDVVGLKAVLAGMGAYTEE